MEYNDSNNIQTAFLFQVLLLLLEEVNSVENDKNAFFVIWIPFQGPVSLSDVSLEKYPPATTTPTTKPTTQSGKRRDEWMNQQVAPKWQELISSDSTFQVAFDMLDDLINPLHSAFSINKDMRRSVRFRYINLKASTDIVNLPQGTKALSDCYHQNWFSPNVPLPRLYHV